MEKQALLVRTFQVMEHIRPHKRRGACGKRDTGHAEKDKEMRLPPAAKDILCTLLKVSEVNQRTLAKKLHITAQAVSEVVRKLEEKGLILKTEGALNNENKITLTPEGHSVAIVLDERIKRHAERLFANFTEEELRTFEALIEKLDANQGDEEGH